MLDTYFNINCYREIDHHASQIHELQELLIRGKITPQDLIGKLAENCPEKDILISKIVCLGKKLRDPNIDAAPLLSLFRDPEQIHGFVVGLVHSEQEKRFFSIETVRQVAKRVLQQAELSPEMKDLLKSESQALKTAIATPSSLQSVEPILQSHVELTSQPTRLVSWEMVEKVVRSHLNLRYVSSHARGQDEKQNGIESGDALSLSMGLASLILHLSDQRKIDKQIVDNHLAHGRGWLDSKSAQVHYCYGTFETLKEQFSPEDRDVIASEFETALREFVCTNLYLDLDRRLPLNLATDLVIEAIANSTVFLLIQKDAKLVYDRSTYHYLGKIGRRAIPAEQIKEMVTLDVKALRTVLQKKHGSDANQMRLEIEDAIVTQFLNSIFRKVEDLT